MSHKGLDNTKLRVLSTSGTPRQQRDAKRVLSLMSLGFHWVLSSLLVSNVIVNETLPVFLDELTGGGGVAAIFISSSLIVLFGEIVPQAICARHGLAIGSKCVNLVKVLMYLEAPITWPVAKCLDFLLGRNHGTMYRKIELKTLLGLHGNEGSHTLSDDEVRIVSSLLDLSDKRVGQVMTPIEDVYTLSADEVLSHAKVAEIVAEGHSRIPVHAPGNSSDFIGMLMVKKIVAYDPEDEQSVGEFELLPLPETRPDLTCLDALNFFLQGSSHMLLVSKAPGQKQGVVGVVSLEDVVEEMLGKEIVDETDVFVDVHLRTPVNRQKSVNDSDASSRRSSVALAPLLRDISDRRKARVDSLTRPASPYVALSSSGTFPPPMSTVGNAASRGLGSTLRNSSAARASTLRSTSASQLGRHSSSSDSKPLLLGLHDDDDDDEEDIREPDSANPKFVFKSTTDSRGRSVAMIRNATVTNDESNGQFVLDDNDDDDHREHGRDPLLGLETD
ncbi:cell agglutination protein Mam3 [Microbotryomycetes sp. JL201]|nr:cell agglutination protein Mam3 [Microbotryomycetes sp. JL201]